MTAANAGPYHGVVSDNQGERVESVSFDRILERLRQVIRQLETGNLSLEESLAMYEEGVGLAKNGHTLLDDAEKRVELLVRDQRGDLAAVPLDDPAESGAKRDPDVPPENRSPDRSERQS